MKILFIGDIYGKTGRDTLKRQLPALRQRYTPDWIIANGENVTAGNGLSERHARFLKECGVDIVTTGNHIFSRIDWPELLQKHEYVLRPHNMVSETSVGTGCRVFRGSSGSLAVMNLAGRVFMEAASCPFAAFDRLFRDIPAGVPVFVDFHAEATSEKLALSWYVNGRAAVVASTHTHVQTSDERILPGGRTAVITDAGMTGAVNGIIGVDRDTVIGRFMTGYSEKFLCAAGPGKIEGIVVEVSEEGFATDIERFRVVEES
ncbi:MAG: 2',3'-cyclic-nucleotide 2'-phosphodiesterase, Bsub YmdB [Candidatus Rifleibacterium amylolyticum]|nr:MAG: 2',3'-cyclic-nucleotide 2'-phosphodiesterase, Bsub YmdB [Candidatus Rifleibacterium amylolyticum]